MGGRQCCSQFFAGRIDEVRVYSRALSASEVAGVAGASGAGGLRWLVSDQLGTPRMVIDRTGSLSGVRRHDYLPFGEDAPETRTGVTSRGDTRATTSGSSSPATSGTRRRGSTTRTRATSRARRGTSRAWTPARLGQRRHPADVEPLLLRPEQPAALQRPLGDERHHAERGRHRRGPAQRADPATGVLPNDSAFHTLLRNLTASFGKIIVRLLLEMFSCKSYNEIARMNISARHHD